MSREEPNDQFFTNLNKFVESCAKMYPNKSFKPEISSFVSENNGWFSPPILSKGMKGKLKENFMKKEVQDEFDSLLSVILGEPGERDASNSGSSGSGKESHPKLKQSSTTRAFITKCRIPGHAIRGRKYELDFGIILDGKNPTFNWDFIQVGGDKLEKIDLNKTTFVLGKERTIKVGVTFGSENRTGVYSFAFVDKDGNSMHADNPIKKEIAIIDEPTRGQKSSNPLSATIIKAYKERKEAKVSFILNNTYASYSAKEYRIKVIEGKIEKIVPWCFYPNQYRGTTNDFTATLKDEKCDYFIFTITDEAGRDIIRDPIEIDLHRDDPEEGTYIRFLPEVAIYGEEITAVLSVKNPLKKSIYSELKLENINKDAPIDILTPTIKPESIAPEERKNFLVKFRITTKPKWKPSYKLSIMISYRDFIGNVEFEFKHIEDNPAKQQKSLNEVRPKKAGYKSSYNKGKITGSWAPNGPVVKDMAIKINFRVKNTGYYEWPQDVKVLFIEGDAIYDFSSDVSGVSKLAKGRDGYITIYFKINSQKSEKYLFDLVDNYNHSILEEPLRINLKLGEKLGTSFPASKVAPQHESSKVDHQYKYHRSKDEIAKLLLMD